MRALDRCSDILQGMVHLTKHFIVFERSVSPRIHICMWLHKITFHIQLCLGSSRCML